MFQFSLTDAESRKVNKLFFRKGGAVFRGNYPIFGSVENVKRGVLRGK